MSSLQEALYLAALDPSHLDHEQVVVRFHASVSSEHVVESLVAILQEHAALRTSFTLCQGEQSGVQAWIHPQSVISQRDVDLSHLACEAAERMLGELSQSELHAPFKLDSAPLMRLCMVKLPDGCLAAIWTLHHLLLDRPSLEEAVVQWLSRIDARTLPQTATVPTNQLDRHLVPSESEGEPETALTDRYFGDLLAGLTEITCINFGVAHRELAPSSPSRDLEVALSPSESAQIWRGAHALETDFASLCEVGFAIALSHFTQRTDLLFGVGVRSEAPLRQLGSLSGPLLARLDCSVERPLEKLLQEVRGQRMARLAHMGASLREIRRSSSVSREHPLFETCLLVEPQSFAEFVTTRIRPAWLAGIVHRFTSSVPLVFSLEGGREQVNLRITYHPARLDDTTAHGLLQQVARLLPIVARTAADTPISFFEPLSPRERCELVDHWNDTQRVFPSHLRLHDLFDAHAARDPRRVALVSRAGSLTFGELEARANQLAHTMLALDVVAGDRVGLCLPRGFDLVASMLAVSKLGASYVPLEPQHPEERTRFTLEDTSARLVVVQGATFSRTSPCRVLDLDDARETIARSPVSRPPCPRSSEDEAYVIYTSGSTGKPKGVVVRHRAAANVIDWVNRHFEVSADDRLLFVTSVCFDLSVYDVFGVLGAGASLYVATADELTDPHALTDVIASQDITLWDSAPAALTQLVPFLASASRCKLRLALLSGDWIPVNLPGQLRSVFPGLRVASLGGATEATVWSNYYEITDVPSSWPSIPYGKPIQNARYYVLDPAMRALPVGVSGELYIGGACLADGYLHRPELTRERFIESPFAAGEQLYRTGDLARHMPDGQLEFLGRRDAQVKVRGFRVELGEIESVLLQVPCVSACVVEAPVLSDGQRSLVAYVVADTDIPAATLRAACRLRMPDYMVPARYVFLPALPVNANGKIDRGGLPLPAPEGSGLAPNPQSPLEAAIARRFENLLGARHVGLDDNFFELGGHSLLATQLISELNQELGASLSLPRFLSSPNVRALAAHFAMADACTPAQRISPRASAAPVVSLEQSRLAFVQGLDPDVATYNIALGFRLEGSLDAALLQQALHAVVSRHEPLRTSFAPGHDGLEARIHDTFRLPWEERDLSALDPSEREINLHTCMREVSGTPFHLERAPLLRALLIRLDSREHALLIAVHHIVFDGPSGAILLRETLAHYDALVAGQEPAVPSLALRFNDVARHQLAEFARSDHAEDLVFWRKELAPPLPILQLPHDRPRPHALSFRGGVHAFDVDLQASRALRQLAQGQHASVFTVLLSAFTALLHRYSGQDDVLVAIPVAMRDQRETQDLIGLLLNTLVIRSKLSSDTTFRAHLRSIRERFLEALSHRELPFERLVAELNPPRDPSMTPVFQAFFSYEETTGRDAKSQNLSVTPLVVDQVFAGTDLSLFVEDNAETGIRGYFEFSSDLFEPSTVASMADAFLRFLRELPRLHAVTLMQVNLLSPLERHAQLSRWNQTELSFDLERSVVNRFEDMARRHGKKSAVHFEASSLSYRDLRAGVQLLAAELRSQGIGPGTGVAVMLDRSPRLLIALLSILKTGAYYIPLDPTHPPERNRAILSSAAPALLLVEASTRGQTPRDLRSPLFDLDASGTRGSAHPFGLPTRVDPDSLAYVIFTSGSTGTPKGVGVTHRALTNLLCSMALRPGFGVHDRMLALTTISFDIAALELFLPLITGGTLEIGRRELALEPKALLARLRHTTVFQATPTMLRMLLEHGLESRSHLRLLCGGEPLSSELARALRPKVGALWNMYGPTETTVWSSVEEIEPQVDVVSIGHPIHNTTMYVLDDALLPVPPGVVGEIFIGGTGVAAGYHERPELTAQAFIPDPFSTRLGARLYRTGDLGRRLADGRLVCLGRRDFQVKVRGYRVELGEIESALVAHPAIRQAVVHPQRPEGMREPILVAYVVLERNASAAPELDEALRAKLPHYMVPGHIEVLPVLPLTPNGKIDRSALPAPSLSALAESGSTHVGIDLPRSDVELSVLRIVTKHLGLARLGMHEDFFARGGHSLMAVRVVRELNETFGLSLPVGVLFQSPSVAGLSAAIVTGGGKLSGAVVPLQQGQAAPPLYFICGIHLYQELAQNLGDQASYGIFVHDEQAFLENSDNVTGASLSKLACAYVDAIKTQHPQGPYALAGVSFGGLLAFEVARLLRERGDAVDLLVLLDSVLPCALRRRTGTRLRHALRRVFYEPFPGLVERAHRRLKTQQRPSAVDPRPDLLWRAFSGPLTQRYLQAGPHYDGPTLVVRAAERTDLVGVEVATDLGWSRHIRGPLQVADAMGDHLGILARLETAALIREHLELWRKRANGATSGSTFDEHA